jgi:hypothetical protein
LLDLLPHRERDTSPRSGFSCSFLLPRGGVWKAAQCYASLV